MSGTRLHSHLKWVEDLALKASSSSSNRSISSSELSSHSSKVDAWTSVHGYVYDMTSYLAVHPGGASILMKVAGKDGTILFEKYHKWVNHRYILGPLSVGSLMNAAPSILEGDGSSSCEHCKEFTHKAGSMGIGPAKTRQLAALSWLPSSPSIACIVKVVKAAPTSLLGFSGRARGSYFLTLSLASPDMCLGIDAACGLCFSFRTSESVSNSNSSSSSSIAENISACIPFGYGIILSHSHLSGLVDVLFFPCEAPGSSNTAAAPSSTSLDASFHSNHSSAASHSSSGAPLFFKGRSVLINGPFPISTLFSTTETASISSPLPPPPLPLPSFLNTTDRHIWTVCNNSNLIMRRRSTTIKSGGEAIVWPSSLCLNPDKIGIITEGPLGFFLSLPLFLGGLISKKTNAAAHCSTPSSSGSSISAAARATVSTAHSSSASTGEEMMRADAGGVDTAAFGILEGSSDDDDDEEEDYDVDHSTDSSSLSLLAGANGMLQDIVHRWMMTRFTHSLASSAEAPIYVIHHCRLEGIDKDGTPLLSSEEMLTLEYLACIAEECRSLSVVLQLSVLVSSTSSAAIAWMDAASAAGAIEISSPSGIGSAHSAAPSFSAHVADDHGCRDGNTLAALLDRVRLAGVSIIVRASAGASIAKPQDVRASAACLVDGIKALSERGLFPVPAERTCCIAIGSPFHCTITDSAFRDIYYVASQCALLKVTHP